MATFKLINTLFYAQPFLTSQPGLNLGFIIAEVTTAALMSENKHLANLCSINSTPTSANQEDHVSMAPVLEMAGALVQSGALTKTSGMDKLLDEATT